MNKFIRNLATEWRKLNLPFAGATFVAAISGGADSVSLLLALNELKTLGKMDLRFVVAHFNHKLRGEASDEDEAFVRDLAIKFNFELALGQGEIAPEKGNLEQSAREARYKFLTETAGKLEAYAVLTAHTLNDQAETFLFNLIRGSGLDGLGGMKPKRSLYRTVESGESEEKPEIQLIRPLLNWAKREDTENFCRAGEIEFRYDSMNEDLKFNRVRIRKVLLPLLKDFNPKIIETLAKTAKLLREDGLALDAAMRWQSDARKETEAGKLESATENRKPKTENQFENISLIDLKDVFPSMRRMILREWLEKNRGNLRRLELKHIEAIEKLIFSRKSGRIVELPDGEMIIKQRGKLTFQKAKVEKS